MPGSRKSYLLLIGVIGLGAATFFSLMYAGFLQRGDSFQPRISEQNAIGLAEENLKRMHHDAHEIRILDGARKGYIPLASFKDDQHLPLLFVHQNGTSFAVNRNNGTIALWGTCAQHDSPSCRFLLPFNRDYEGALVYIVGMQWVDANGNELTDTYGVNASTGKIIEPSNLRAMGDNR